MQLAWRIVFRTRPAPTTLRRRQIHPELPRGRALAEGPWLRYPRRARPRANYSLGMPSCSIARVGRVLDGIRGVLDDHARDCGDRVVGVSLHPADHAELSIAEVWGLPVLAWEDVPQGKIRLLCDAQVVLIPRIDTCQDLLDRWRYHLERPLPSDPMAA
jgi:hypothetical protein